MFSSFLKYLGLLVFIDDAGLGFAALQIDKAGKQRNLVVLVEVIPNLCGKCVDVAFDDDRCRLTFIGRDWVAVAAVGVDEMSLTCLWISYSKKYL